MKIYVLGAGKSSYYLLAYLTKYEKDHQRVLTVLDIQVEEEMKKTFPEINFLEADLYSEASIENFKNAKVVVSFLPANFHHKAAELCLEHHCHLVTASYATEKMSSYSDLAEKKGLCFMMEMGLDPGIDHMSAMQMTQRIKEAGYTITSFKSYCGALIAKESDDNPWHYKFTWNPMNVVLAGQSVAGYIEGGKRKFLSASNVFEEVSTIKTPQGDFDGYYNRDSISYTEKYNLLNCDSFVRGTLRGKGFCEAWKVLLDLGFTDNGTDINVVGLSVREVFLSFILKRNLKDDFWLSIKNQVGEYSENTQKCLEYLEIDSNSVLPISQVTPAEYLLAILKEKWKLKEGDKDRVVLFHEVIGTKDGNSKTFKAVLDLNGEDEHKTAIAKTVSLPAAIGATLLVEDKIKLRGVQIPTHPDIYKPVLDQLAELGIKLQEF